MTAFASAAVEANGSRYVCEIKTLNSRFLEANVRLPRPQSYLETQVLARVKKALARGKVEVTIMARSLNAKADLPVLNEPVLRHYIEIFHAMQEAARKIGRQGTPFQSPTHAEMLQLEGVLEAPDPMDAEADGTQAAIFGLLEQVLADVNNERRKEGAALAQAFKDLIAELDRHHEAVAQRTDEITRVIYETYTTRLRALQGRLAENGLKVASDLPEERLMLEISILTDKSDITEELTRLKTHTQEFLALLATPEAGRKMDFLCQEMHREVNTIASKVLITEVATHTREMKHTIEKIRQQVQNIE